MTRTLMKRPAIADVDILTHTHKPKQTQTYTKTATALFEYAHFAKYKKTKC